MLYIVELLILSTQNYAVVQATLPGIQNLGYRFWIVWACICFAFIPITYLFYPEVRILHNLL